MIELLDRKPDVWEIDKIVKWLNDPVLTQYSQQRHLRHTAASQTEYLYGARTFPNQYRVVHCNGVLIGTVSAIVDSRNDVADVGILIGSEHTGKGHGCEVWRLFCDHLAKIQGIRKIEGGCMSHNKAMLRIFEKNSMRLEGTRRYHFQIGLKQYDDMVLYGKLT